jgi:hypothetical protein
VELDLVGNGRETASFPDFLNLLLKTRKVKFDRFPATVAYQVVVVFGLTDPVSSLAISQQQAVCHALLN